ncbi:hypothetical protein [Afifella sp. IM 167]|uniref:hypothetical protein n=1 Tax=Afifella sp. IM 167 TaxID=2033586 RepID=UPI001CCD6C6F|nr:hypothetical protein [Afifella sp. IM 167]MBZ8132913.1 hypothetical protein [Afifella sp. IM 167]
MASGISQRAADAFNSLYAKACTSPEGRRLALLIECNFAAMILASEKGKPALAPLLPLLDDDLEAALQADDRLMNAFGHMAALEMEVHGWDWDGKASRTVHWPYSSTHVSDLAVFSR